MNCLYSGKVLSVVFKGVPGKLCNSLNNDPEYAFQRMKSSNKLPGDLYKKGMIPDIPQKE